MSSACWLILCKKISKKGVDKGVNPWYYKSVKRTREETEMLNYYFTYYTTKLNGEVINSNRASCICTEEEVKDEAFSINWENLKDFYYKYGLVCGFNVWNTKKGQRIGLFGKAFKDRKEWKHPETGLTFEITHRVYEPSIQTILNWHDQRKAIQYLTERGLKIGG